MRTIGKALVLAMALSGIAALSVAQTLKTPTFEVASVKPNIGGGTASDFQTLPGGRFVATNRTITDLIFHAYRLQPYQIPDTPPSIPDHFDIEGKADGNPTYNEMMVMLQSLLQDRFKLKVHWGSMEQPIFLITAARSGIKLKPSTATCVHFDQTASIRSVNEQNHLPNCRNLMSGGQKRRWIAESVGMEDVTSMLSCACLLGRKVIDQTGFPGRFDFNLEFTGDSLNSDGDLPPLITAFQDQLGLRIESGKAAVEVLVIDSIQRPSEN